MPSVPSRSGNAGAKCVSERKPRDEDGRHCRERCGVHNLSRLQASGTAGEIGGKARRPRSRDGRPGLPPRVTGFNARKVLELLCAVADEPSIGVRRYQGEGEMKSLPVL
jgi:hypothetical protein